MIKFIISLAIVTGWIVLLDKGFPSDHDNANIYTIGSFLLLACWVAGGLIFMLFKYKAPSIRVFIVLTLVSCIVVYNYFPWYKGYTGLQIIKEYASKKKSTKEVDSRWIYSLPARIENYPLIDLAQRKFAKEIKPDKCYFFQRFYYDSSGMQQHIDQYIIYFKDNKPFTTEPAIGFAQKPDGSYELQETIKGQSSAVITAKNNSIKLITPDNCQPTGKTNENYYCTNGRNIVTLKPTNLFNGLNIRSAYWIYRFL